MKGLWMPLAGMIAGMALAPFAACQDSFTLDHALAMARARNGAIRVALLTYESARRSVVLAEGAYLPTLGADFRYDVDRRNFQTGAPGTSQSSTGATLSVDAGWTLFDTGERQWNLAGAKRDAEAAEATALQTLRQTLFLVHQDFFDAIRTQELMAVQSAQLKRSEVILDQTKTRVETGDAPRKDILQAEADFLNAKASFLQSRNRVTTALATLKASVGWDGPGELPPLEALGTPDLPPPSFTLDEAMVEGLSSRADLRSRRKRVESRRVDLRLAKIAAGVTWTLDGVASKSFAPDVSDRIGLIFRATLPILDGYASRENIRLRQISLESEEQSLLQAERDAKAEIESAYKEFEQNREILAAAKAALEAARLNFRAAEESQRLGAGDLIEVLTAQVSLATAESNHVQAVYDMLSADIRLRLAMGQPVPGETR
ncbi:MAG TPA: TolC family protein [Fimbriimonadaceae bacterium]|nr:TolC family protein [Fimbriimonadaceae bacterium]HRJ96223.1 TolC family protein [Fimbriimonadaceae bacterium]